MRFPSTQPPRSQALPGNAHREALPRRVKNGAEPRRHPSPGGAWERGWRFVLPSIAARGTLRQPAFAPPSPEPAVNRRITRRTAIKTGAALAATATLPFEAAAQEPKSPPRPAIEAYTDQLSYVLNDEVNLHVSCEYAEFDFKVYRVGP